MAKTEKSRYAPWDTQFQSVDDLHHPHLEQQARDGVQGWIDTFAMDRFGLDMWFAPRAWTYGNADRNVEVNGYPVQSYDRWIGAGHQTEKYWGRRPFAAHQYRITDQYKHPDEGMLGILGPHTWVVENGNPDLFLTSDPDLFIINCQVRTRDGNKHGPSIVPLRTFFQLDRRCWTCLHEENIRRPNTQSLDKDNPRLASQMSELNIGLRADMLKATSKSDVIWECPTCTNRWIIPIFLRARQGRTNCPSCQTNVSRAEIEVWLALLKLLPATDVRHGESVTGVSASDIILPEYKVIVEYDGDLHSEDLKVESDLRKDSATYHLGWRTIRLRMTGLTDVTSPGTTCIETPRSGKVGAVLPKLLGVLSDHGVVVPNSAIRADHHALLRSIANKVSTHHERMSYRRKNTKRKRSAH
jgi:very-short-patch-repair endonuclease